MTPTAAAQLVRCCVLVLPFLCQELACQGIHPLDPLTRDEMEAAVSLLSEAGHLTPTGSLVLLELREPGKDELSLPRRPPREAFAVVYERGARTTHEAVVDLDAGRVRVWRERPGVQPPFLVSDYVLLREVVHGSEELRAALRARGIDDPAQVEVIPWMGGRPLVRGSAPRTMRATFNHRSGTRNAYARPVEGLVAHVDLDARTIVRVEDEGTVPLPAAHEFGAGAGISPRPALAPLRIESPEGPGFSVDGHEVRWDRWRFRVAVTPREGLVLHEVRWTDRAGERAVLHRASVSEVVVPYGDPRSTWFFRNAFDAGEYGLGGMSTSRVDPGLDAQPNAVFLPALYADEEGEVVEVPRAVALYERDGGILWKHANVLEERNDARRGRDLVVSYAVTLGNYDYVFRWIFRQDGTLEHEVQLTGIMAVRALGGEAEGHHGGSAYGHAVLGGLEAVHHQHFFNLRLDLDVDGPVNRVVEMNTRPIPRGRANPHGNAFVMEETVLRREREARRTVNLATNRGWRVVSATERNALGAPTGYALVPLTNTLPLMDPGAEVRRRAGFVDAHLWVTPYDPGERYAAGDYVNQSTGGEGLPRWTAANRALVDRDVVLWYTLGTTHLPRPEEWPVMPTLTIGFKLVPFGFFERNPALDVPPPAPEAQ